MARLILVRPVRLRVRADPYEGLFEVPDMWPEKMCKVYLCQFIVTEIEMEIVNEVAYGNQTESLQGNNLSNGPKRLTIALDSQVSPISTYIRNFRQSFPMTPAQTRVKVERAAVRIAYINQCALVDKIMVQMAYTR